MPTTAQAKLDVVTTTTDLAEIVEAVGGSAVKVSSICRGDQDPHYVQARPSYMVRLNRADLVVAVGLELEVGWLPLLIQGARNPKINPGKPGYFNASTAIQPIEIPSGTIDRSAGDIHQLGNPHYWLDPENVKLVATAIAKRLAQLAPKDSAAFNHNAAQFNARIDAALKRWQTALAPFRGSEVVSYHRTFNYFLRRFELKGFGYVEERPGIPPSPAHLADLTKAMKAAGVRLILHESYHDRANSELVARRSGATVAVLPTSVNGTKETDSYEKLIDALVAAVSNTLQRKPSP